MRLYTLIPFLLTACSAPPMASEAPPGAPGGPEVPAPAAPPVLDATVPPALTSTPLAPPDIPSLPEDDPPTVEDLAAAAAPELPPTEADVLAATNPEPPPLPPEPQPPTLDERSVEQWENTAISPPYTGWTKRAGVVISGMGGRPLLSLERAGVRVEVMAEDGERLNVQCIGCPPPWENSGGWIAVDDVQPVQRALDADSPLHGLLDARISWGKGADRVPAGLSRDGLCRLADRGYTLQDGVATWTEDGASISVEQRNGQWTLNTTEGPQSTAKSWRCPLTLPSR